MRRLAKVFLVSAFAVSVAAGLLVSASAVQAKDKIVVETKEDLPRYTYSIPGKASDLLTSDEAFETLGAEVRANLEGLLDTYAIQDKSTLKEIYSTLRSLAYRAGDFETALAYTEKMTAIEDKEAARLTAGLALRAKVAAREETGKGVGDPAFHEAFRRNLATGVAALPWETVQETLEQMNGQMQIFSENLVMGLVQGQLDPAVEKSGFLSGDQATMIVTMKTALDVMIPLKADLGAVLSEAIAAHQVEKEDLWGGMQVSFTGKEGYSPVRVAVWDSGVDVDVYPGQVYTNTDEKLDGEDNDGNGYVDDIHGIAFDLHGAPTSELLYPLGDAEDNREGLENQIKGFMDIQASLDTPEAGEVKQAIGGMPPAEITPYLENLNLYAHHSHGTHVAGISVAGNPYADILVARLTFDHRMIPEAPTMETVKSTAKSYGQAVEYFKAHGVRAVNMSWGMSTEEIEAALEANGIGENAEERGKQARAMFEVLRDALRDAMAGAPDILFVAAAGNSNNDVTFDEFIPSGFTLPNLLVVGAVDQACEATGFTSFGGTVKVYANGYEVESYVPGGRRLPFSGTSMASPNALNLAAKLLAVKPSLKPAEVIDLMVAGAEDRGEDGQTMLVLDPARTVKLLRETKSE